MINKLEHQPRKRFGQNFLIDQRIIERILQAINPQPHDHLVEIGPGLGALTKNLVGKTASFDAIEIDRDLSARLSADFVAYPSFHLHVADALRFDFMDLQRNVSAGSPVSAPSPNLRVMGNLPYNITTPLLFYLFTQITAIKDMHFMLQREVAERIVAAPGSKTYGRLSIMMQYYCRTEILFAVPPTAFSPPPQVHSSFVRFIPLSPPPHIADDLQLFADVVRTAFNQRRKTIRNGLKDFVGEAEWRSLQIDPQTRPEQLSVEHFVAISNIIGRTRNPQTIIT